MTFKSPTPNAQTVLLMSLREALIIAIGAIETYLGIDRSIVPRRKRQPPERDDH